MWGIILGLFERVVIVVGLFCRLLFVFFMGGGYCFWGGREFLWWVGVCVSFVGIVKFWVLYFMKFVDFFLF